MGLVEGHTAAVSVPPFKLNSHNSDSSLKVSCGPSPILVSRHVSSYLIRTSGIRGESYYY